jgi:hypothetical protein
LNQKFCCWEIEQDGKFFFFIIYLFL